MAESLGDAGFTSPSLPGGALSIAAQSGQVSKRRWQMALAANAVLLVVAAAAWLRPTPDIVPSRQRVVLWQHPLEQQLSPGIAGHATQAAIAPDGSSIVFSDSVGGDLHLFRKLRGEGTPTLLPGTEGGQSPFFSPDGRWIGYVTIDGMLRKVPVDGGNSLTLTDDVSFTYKAATWLDDDRIVYIDDATKLRGVFADGGSSSVVIGEGENGIGVGGRGVAHFSALPGSRGILFTDCPGNCAVSSSIKVFDVAVDSAHELVPNGAGAWYSPTGHLLYTDRAGGLFAAGFDLDRLVLTTGAVPVIDDVAPMSFVLSASGSVLYSIGTEGGSESELVWVTRDGTATSLDSTWRGTFEYPALSPDGETLAVSLSDGTTQLWIRRSDGRRLQMTQDGQVNWRPFWTSDGRSLAFLSNRRGGEGQNNYDAYLMPVDGSTSPELLLRHTFGLWEVEFTHDGEWLVVRADEDGMANVRGRRQSGDTTLVPLVVNKGLTTQIALSPDGRWLAYSSAASGIREVYLSSFPSMSSRRLISRNGGTEPRWAHSGRELFYKSGNQFMVVEMTPGATLQPGMPRALFSLEGYRAARNRQQYDVAPDDSRFLMIREIGAQADAEVVYVENWFAELEAKVNR
jgi:serine/threonine-protein kinase